MLPVPPREEIVTEHVLQENPEGLLATETVISVDSMLFVIVTGCEILTVPEAFSKILVEKLRGLGEIVRLIVSAAVTQEIFL